MRAARAISACGVAGPALLVIYFATPFVAGWPFNGGSPTAIASYASSHSTLFYAGAWLQTIGTLLSVVFLIGVMTTARASTDVAGVMVVVGCGSLLAVVLVESALTAYVPTAAAAGDAQSAATAFGLINGVFAHVFPLAPASVPYLGLGAIIVRSSVIDRRFGYAAIGLGLAFQLAGALAVFSSAGIILVGALAGLQALWVIAAALAFDRTRLDNFRLRGEPQSQRA